MHWVSLLSIVSLFFAGTLAGIEIASHYGLITGADFLAEKEQVQLRQALVRRLRVLVPSFFAPAFLSTIAVTLLAGVGYALALRCVALVGYTVWIYARVVATMRINSASVDWNPSSPPPDWRSLVARAERFHIMSLWAVAIGFACLLIADQPWA
jgi:hypothetical protein